MYGFEAFQRQEPIASADRIIRQVTYRISLNRQDYQLGQAKRVYEVLRECGLNIIWQQQY